MRVRWICAEPSRRCDSRPPGARAAIGCGRHVTAGACQCALTGVKALSNCDQDCETTRAKATYDSSAICLAARQPTGSVIMPISSRASIHSAVAQMAYHRPPIPQSPANAGSHPKAHTSWRGLSAHPERSSQPASGSRRAAPGPTATPGCAPCPTAASAPLRSPLHPPLPPPPPSSVSPPQNGSSNPTPASAARAPYSTRPPWPNKSSPG